MQTQLRFPINEMSQTAEARRVMSELAHKLGFNATETGKVALVVTEAATNLLKHAKQGQLLMRAVEQAGDIGLELLVLDRGPAAHRGHLYTSQQSLMIGKRRPPWNAFRFSS